MALKAGENSSLRRVLGCCVHAPHLRRTLTIAAIVGSWLTLFNQGDVLWSGGASPVVLLKVALNYLTPFMVANLGLLSSERKRESSAEPASDGVLRGEDAGKR